MKRLSTISLSFILILLSINHLKTFGQCVEKDIILTSQQQIDNFSIDYPDCSVITKDLIISDTNNTITNLNGLKSITEIEGNLFIMQNDSLTNLNGLNNLTAIKDGLHIHYNENLQNFKGLDNLVEIGWIDLFRNYSLINFEGLETVSTLGELVVNNNENLTNFIGLDNIYLINGNFRISENNKLTSFHGLDNVTIINGMVDIGMNNSLRSMDGLENLTAIIKSFYLNSLPSLTNTNGLSRLELVGRDLGIAECDSLMNLSGFENLSSIEGKLVIILNGILNNINSLYNINPGTISELEIWKCPKLSFCNLKNICEYLSITDNQVKISNNASGCDSVAQLKNTCGLITSNTKSTAKEVMVFPNPTNGILHISDTFSENLRYSIYNSAGITLIKNKIGTNGTINISNLPKGFYFVKLQDKNISTTIKVAKH